MTVIATRNSRAILRPGVSCFFRALKRFGREELGFSAIKASICLALIAAAVKVIVSYFQVAGDAMVGTTRDAESRAGEAYEQHSRFVQEGTAFAARFKKMAEGGSKTSGD